MTEPEMAFEREGILQNISSLSDEKPFSGTNATVTGAAILKQ